MNPVLLPATSQACIDRLTDMPAKTYDCIQVNLALLFDAIHAGQGPGADAQLGRELVIRPRPQANGLPTVDAAPSGEVARCSRLLDLAAEPIVAASTASCRDMVQRRSAVERGSVTYVVGDAHALPWLPYYGRAHMPHSFLVAAGPDGSAEVIDAYDNQTEWGAYEPGHAVIPWSALPADVQAWTVRPTVPKSVRATRVELDGVDGYVHAYRTHFDRIEAWDQLAVETWLLTRKLTLFAAAHTSHPDLGQRARAAADQWHRLAADVFLVMRRVRQSRPEPSGVLDDIQQALSDTGDLHLAASTGGRSDEWSDHA